MNSIDQVEIVVHPGGRTGGVIKGDVDIGISLKGKVVWDFDGCFELPRFAVVALRAGGYRFAKDVLPEVAV